MITMASHIKGFSVNARFMLHCIGNRRIHILMYHSIADDPRDKWAVPKAVFKSQMQWLRWKKYRVLSLRQALNELDHGPSGTRRVVLTFDDGYEDFLENALPVLCEYSFPATLFALAGGCGRISHWERPQIRKRLLDWNGLREVVGSGCSIGCHGMVHADLTKLQPKDLAREVGDSKAMLEDRLGISVDAFSYPWGRHGFREAAAVRKAGYACAVAVGSQWGNGPETDRFRLEREAMSRDDFIEEFPVKVAGHKKVLKRMQSRIAAFCRTGHWTLG